MPPIDIHTNRESTEKDTTALFDWQIFDEKCDAAMLQQGPVSNKEKVCHLKDAP